MIDWVYLKGEFAWGSSLRAKQTLGAIQCFGMTEVSERAAGFGWLMGRNRAAIFGWSIGKMSPH
jgi:hypothetical protein